MPAQSARGRCAFALRIWHRANGEPVAAAQARCKRSYAVWQASAASSVHHQREGAQRVGPDSATLPPTADPALADMPTQSAPRACMVSAVLKRSVWSTGNRCAARSSVRRAGGSRSAS